LYWFNFLIKKRTRVAQSAMVKRPASMMKFSMALDLKELLVATNPMRTLVAENPDDRQ
jgi:predicted NAD-dependent protein-ADP-ribosyltransferase YbiA (DUF1768 family)